MSDTSFHGFRATTIEGKAIDFASLEGKVVLIENVASLWGTTTRDYTQLNDLVAKFGDQLAVLAFPCNQFGHQENTNNDEILSSLKHVRPGNGFVPSFPVFEKTQVNGSETDPIFTYLKKRLPFPSDAPDALIANPGLVLWSPICRSDISWNFEKFLLDKSGKPFKRYSRNFETKNIADDIAELLK